MPKNENTADLISAIAEVGRLAKLCEYPAININEECDRTPLEMLEEISYTWSLEIYGRETASKC